MRSRYFIKFSSLEACSFNSRRMSCSPSGELFAGIMPALEMPSSWASSDRARSFQLNFSRLEETVSRNRECAVASFGRAFLGNERDLAEIAVGGFQMNRPVDVDLAEPLIDHVHAPVFVYVNTRRQHVSRRPVPLGAL